MCQAPQTEGGMCNLYWLSEDQMARLWPYFPQNHGAPHADDRRVLSGIILINRNGLRWCDAPKQYGPHKTLYNRWKQCFGMGVFARFLTGLTAEAPDPNTISIGATYLKAHCTASSLRLKKRGRGRLIGRTKGGINTKLHAVNEIVGRPIVFFLTAGQVSDFTEARAPVNSLPAAGWLLVDRGYDADWFCETVVDGG